MPRNSLDRCRSFLPGWRPSSEIQDRCREWSLPPLLASFGASLLERAILDAICRMHGVSFAAAIRTNVFGIVAGDVHRELAGLQPADWLPAKSDDGDLRASDGWIG